MGILLNPCYGAIQEEAVWVRAEPKQDADLPSVLGEIVYDLRNDDETADSGRVDKPLFRISIRESILSSVRSIYANKIGAMKGQATI